MSDPVKDYLATIGAKGGSAGKGASKARTSEQARKAANARWKNHAPKHKPLKDIER